MKKIIPILTYIFTVTTLASSVGAATDTMSVGGIVDVFANVISSARYVAGGALVIMIAYGVWKSSMALGDPRGLEGAKLTWTYAIFGFFVVMGVYIIIALVAGVFGVSINPQGLFGGLKGALEELIGLPASHQTSP